jgi:hypothetical protein
MSAKRVGSVIAAAAISVLFVGVDTALAAAEQAPAMVEQHADLGLPLAACAATIGLALRRQRAWYSDPRLARALAPLPQDYMYLPPK